MDSISISQAASFLEVSQRTIYNYINDGLLTLYKIRKSKPVLDKEEVEKGRIARILAVKRAFLALPQAIAPILAGKVAGEIQASLTNRIREIIGQFAGQK